MRSTALEAGEAARATLPGGAETVMLRARAFRADALDALGIEVDQPTFEIVRVGVH